MSIKHLVNFMSLCRIYIKNIQSMLCRNLLLPGFSLTSLTSAVTACSFCRRDISGGYSSGISPRPSHPWAPVPKLPSPSKFLAHPWYTGTLKNILHHIIFIFRRASCPENIWQPTEKYAGHSELKMWLWTRFGDYPGSSGNAIPEWV